jgi:hypothetical protein
MRDRTPSDGDFQGATCGLIAIGDVDLENRLVLAAHRHGVPVHVAERFVMSDFSLLAFLERDPSSVAQAWNGPGKRVA